MSRGLKACKLSDDDDDDNDDDDNVDDYMFQKCPNKYTQY
jgi:hypothetical protein